MAGVFDRYHECTKLINAMPDGEDKEYAGRIAAQLLHIEQARKVAQDNYNRYCNEMNAWENNIVRSVKQLAKQKRMDADAPERGKDGRE